MYNAYYKILKATSTLQTTVVSSENQACEQTNKQTNKKTSTQTDTSVQSLLAEDSAPAPTSNASGEYSLLLESYSTNASAKIAIDTLGTLPANVKSKIVVNKNGSHTIALSNIDSLEKAIELKNQFAAKFPKSYYIKKK
jgi:hypothetical protein